MTLTSINFRSLATLNTVSVSLLVGVCCAAVAEEPWSFYRGPHYDGHVAKSELTESWPADGPPVLWVRRAGTGCSSLVAWKNRVATQWQTLAGQYVVCLDADTGETVWRYRYDWPYLPESVYPGPRSSPTYWNGRVLFAAPDGLVGCLDADSGKLLWSDNFKQRFSGKGTGFGYSCSPAVIDGRVVLPVGGANASMVAMDVRTGKLIWRAGDEPASYASALPISYKGRQLVVGYLKNALVCHDLSDGELMWRFPLSTGYDEHSCWPIYREPYLWIAAAFRGGSQLLEIRGSNELSIKPVWKSPLMSNDILSSVLVGDALFGFDVSDAQAKAHRPTRGSFRCLSFLEGQHNWATSAERRRRPGDEATDDRGRRIGHASVVVADGKLLLLNDTGELILARASSSEYMELGRTQILGGEICWTQPILYRNRVYARNQSRIVCVYVGEPSQLARSTLSSSTPAAELPQEKYRDVAAVVLGIEPEFAFDVPSVQRCAKWFLVSWLGVLGISWLVAFCPRLLARRRTSHEVSRRVFWCLAFFLGLIGTTFLSPWLNDFIFTWHVCIFIAFHATVYQLRDTETVAGGRWGIWRTRLAALFFLATCAAYFLVCRRLSLVFEWVFLCGFVAAMPFCIAGMRRFRSRSWYSAWEALMISLAFSGFHWFSVGILVWKAAQI